MVVLVIINTLFPMKKISLLVLAIMLLSTFRTLAQCNAQFSAVAAPSGANLLNVNFTNSSTASNPTPSGGSYSQSTIDFGDNSWVYFNNTTTSHNYSTPGTYTARVTITSYDSLSVGAPNVYCTDTTYQTITVAYAPCASTVSYQNNGNGSFTFYASNPANTPGITYSWNFGDGSPAATGNQVVHTYSASGTFSVTLTSTGGGCTSTNTITVNSYVPPVFNCSTATSDFTPNVTNSDVLFNNFTASTQNVFDVYITGSWNFGDGTTGTTASYASNISHSYAAVGTYTVTLVNTWTDSSTNQVICTKTSSHNVTITTLSPPPPPAPSVISGFIWGDSINTTSSFNVKVWLITHDPVANSLTAIDSLVLPFTYYTNYQFNNVPSGQYLVKAAVQGQTVGTAGWLPTYSDSSIYWNTASAISHTSGTLSYADIYLRSGLALAGPGFIGGNISSGAGRGTGTGVPNMLVFLRNNSNNAISAVYTNNEGDFSFSNLPLGTYNIYPEDMGYETIPYNTIQITSNNTQKSAIDFEQTETQIKPKTTGIAAIEKNDGLKIYPNPVNNSVFIENNNALFSHVSIINVLGQTVNASSLQKGLNTLNTADINSGIYYLVIEGKERKRLMKIVKE